MRFARVFCSLLLIVALGSMAAFVQADDDPAASVTDESTTEAQQHTNESFDALSDEDKQDIYHNFPELLPENFDPMTYWDLLHAEDTP